jgi:acyl-CoA thioester hydrolase
VGRTLRTRTRVRLSETDAFGVVYYANYFVYFDVARQDLLRRARLLEFLRRRHLSFVAASASCEYHASARLNDLLSLEVKVDLLGDSSVTYDHVVSRAKDSAKLATGRVVDVLVDGKGAARRLPALLRSRLTR